MKGISKRVHIGLDREKLKRVRIVVDVEIGIDAVGIGEKDDLKMGVDYRDIHRTVVDEMKDGYTTIEAMGYRIFKSLEERFKPGHLSVTIKKPFPPLDGEVESAEVEFRL